jgi:hypothetical protein
MMLFSWLVDTAISEEHTVSIFSVEQQNLYVGHGEQDIHQ